MNNYSVEKTQFSSQLVGSALISPPIRLEFTLSGVIQNGLYTTSLEVAVPNSYNYVSDAQYTLHGSSYYQPSSIWKSAPRRFYLADEENPNMSTPRIYLYKKNLQDKVIITLSLSNLGGGTFTLSRTYKVIVDVFLFTSSIAY